MKKTAPATLAGKTGLICFLSGCGPEDLTRVEIKADSERCESLFPAQVVLPRATKSGLRLEMVIT